METERRDLTPDLFGSINVDEAEVSGSPVPL